MPGFTKTAVINTFNHAATTYDSAALIAREVAHRLDERLDLMRIQPRLILDLGAGTGYSSELLAKRYPGAQIVAVDFAERMLKQAHQSYSALHDITWICAAAEHLPLADASVDLVVSSLMLPWCIDLPTVFAQMHRVVKSDGLLLFSTLGPDTLQELRSSWADVDNSAHVHLFFDMHDVGDALLQARWVDPVMDMEAITMSYSNTRTPLRDLRLSGMQNLLELRHQYLTGKNRWMKFLANCEKFCDAESRFPVTYEVIYGHAWRVEQRQNETVQEFSIPVGEIRRR